MKEEEKAMAKVLREYETLFVLHPELTEDAVNQVLEKLKGVITKLGGELMREDLQGKRKLAFAVKKQMRGQFVKFHYVGFPGIVEEIERTMRNAEGVIRWLSNGHGEVTDVEARKVEIDKNHREAEALRKKKEAERAERAAAQEAARAQRAAQGRDRGDRDRGDRDRGDRPPREKRA